MNLFFQEFILQTKSLFVLLKPKNVILKLVMIKV